ncbi:MAG: 5'/3'-nucleotidase SurE [Sumerlaeia bacterium]
MTEANFSGAKILLVNDDGIDAPGLQALRQALEGCCDLLVVAPMSERSGAGCSLSLNLAMPVQKRYRPDGSIWGWSVDGTPADCVKFAMTALGDYRPDLVLSGINRGRNVGNSVFYSGTVAGATEATFFGLRALASSLSVSAEKSEKHFDAAARMVVRLIPWLLEQDWPPRHFWNLNVPNRALDEIKGLRFTHQGTSFFVDDFVLEREEGDLLYYKNVGKHLEKSTEPADSDDIILDAGAASLSLLNLDMTVAVPDAARRALEENWNRIVFGAAG